MPDYELGMQPNNFASPIGTANDCGFGTATVGQFDKMLARCVATKRMLMQILHFV